MENYNNREVLGIEEYFGEVMYLISKKIVSDAYIEENEDFVNEVIRDSYDTYLEGVSIPTIATLLENVFYNMFEYKPSTDRIR